MGLVIYKIDVDGKGKGKFGVVILIEVLEKIWFEIFVSIFWKIIWELLKNFIDLIYGNKILKWWFIYFLFYCFFFVFLLVIY